MKKLILSLAIILLSFSVFSAAESPLNTDTPKFPVGKGAILLEDLKEGKVYGSLEKLAGKKHAKTTRLIGHLSFDAPKDKMLAGNKFVLIGWLGVQKTNDVSKVVMFKEPIVSSFIIKNDTDAIGVSLPTFGEKAYLEAALADLEMDKIDPKSFKEKKVIKAPIGTGSQSVLPVKNVQRKNNGLKSESVIPQIEASTASSHDTIDAEGSALSSLDSSQETKGGSSTYNQTKSPYAPFGQSAPPSTVLEFNGLNGHAIPPGGGANPALDPSPANFRGRQSPNALGRAGLVRNRDVELYLMPELNENNLPTINGEGVVLGRNANGNQEAYFVRRGVFARDQQGNLIHREIVADVAGFQNGRVERNEQNRERIDQIIDAAMFNNNLAEQAQREPVDFGPEITVELTEEGCMPEHDALQERVTIMMRAKKSENGRVIEEGICEKTLEMYGVRRDYLCEGCQDEVNIEDKKAYARYMEYWSDRTQQRHNLGIKLDRGVPFDFFEDKQACGFDTETEAGFAIKLSRLGYLNKFRNFKVVQDCRVIEGAERFAIQETVRGCKPVHNFVERVSHEQKRSYFTVDRVEHELSACHPVEPALPHEFLMTGCYPIVDLTTHHVTNTARRKIMTSLGPKIISEECEPCDNHPLGITRDGCEGEYTHDVVSMRSYLKKRYYFPRGHNHREFVTGCLRTDEFIEQQTEPNGIYEHDDAAKISRPRLSLYIMGDRGRLNVEEARVRGNLGQVPYTLARNEHRPTANIYYEGCFRRTPTQSVNIYTRGDNSVYEETIGPGDIIASNVNECTTLRTERKNDDYWGFIWYERIISVNPNGAVQIGPWVQHGSIQNDFQDRDNGSGGCHSNSRGER